MSLAHFPFYPTDYLGDRAVCALTYEAQGVYVKLLCFMWQAKEGSCSLPLQPEKVAKLLGMDVRRWRRIYGELAPLFTADPATCTFTQDRLRKEWLKAKGLYDRAVKGRAAREAAKRTSAGSRGEVGPKSGRSPAEVQPTSPPNFERNDAEKQETGSEQAPLNQNKNKNKNHKLLVEEGVWGNTASAAAAKPPALVPVPVENWPEGLRWIPPIVERVFPRFANPFGTRGDFLQPDRWRSLEAEVDSWGHGLNQRFADELETVLSEFQGYWTQRKRRRVDAWRTFRNNVKRWHDRNLGAALRLQQKPQRRTP